MKLSNLFEARYAIHKNPMGAWMVRVPGSFNAGLGTINSVVLQNAKPYNESGQKVVKHLIVGDFISGEGYQDRGIGDLEPSPPAQVTGTPRELMFNRDKLNEPNAFEYVDTREEFVGAKFVVFNGNTVTAYD